MDAPVFPTYDSVIGIYCVSELPDVSNNLADMTKDVTFSDPTTNLSEKHLILGNVIIPDPGYSTPLYGGGTHPIALSGAQKCRILGNYISGGSHRSIILSPVAHDNIVEGNYCEGFQSTGIHLAYGSSRNNIVGNTCKTSSSNIEGNIIKGYFGCGDNNIVGNRCEGSIHAGIRFAIRSNNNSIVGNHIKNCRVGIEIESYITTTTGAPNDSDYPFDYAAILPANALPLNPVATEGNTVKSNTVHAEYSVGSSSQVGVRLAQRSRADATPTPFPLKNCVMGENSVIGAPAANGTLDSFVLVEAGGGSLTSLIGLNNAFLGTATNKWVLPRALSHFVQFDNGENIDGWVESAVALTYITGNSFRMLGDWTKYVSVGDKVRFKQSDYTLGDGFKYGYVIGISYSVNTAVQVVLWRDPAEPPPVHSDVISNSPITDAYFSKAASPPGHPIWFKYNPSFMGFPMGQEPAVDALYMIQGRECVLSQQTTAAGNSNANIFTVTAKVRCAGSPTGIPFYAAIEGVDGGVNLLTPGKAVIGANSDIITLHKDFGFNANTWSPTGTKRANFTLVYRI